MTDIELSNLEKRLGVVFKDKDLIRQALVHRSYLNEHPEFPLGNNERLEFLGDAVLEIVVTEYLFNNFPETPEGELTNWRASLVNSKMLYEIAVEMDAEKCLYLSKGEARDKNKKSRQFIMADSVEAMIGAMYLDQGLEIPKKFILENVVTKLDGILQSRAYVDPKSHFQEKAQDKTGITPHYEVLDEVGPDHAKIFTVGLYLGEEQVAVGKGSSKQEAQVAAATAGLQKFSW